MPQSKWTKKSDRLIRDFAFPTFSKAFAFMVEVALFCEKTDHHPEWTNIYNKVHVELTTHDKGGVTAKDKALAAQMDKVYASKS